jgi:tryptophan-rich sensory protein
VALAIPQILGGISGASTAKSILQWYKPDVKKPSWHPPLPLFGSIWPVLYTLIGFASFVVYVEGGSFSRNAGPLTLYAAQLLLNVIWQPLFFNARNLQLAQLDNLGNTISSAISSETCLQMLTFLLFVVTTGGTSVDRRQSPCAKYVNIGPTAPLNQRVTSRVWHHLLTVPPGLA